MLKPVDNISDVNYKDNNNTTAKQYYSSYNTSLPADTFEKNSTTTDKKDPSSDGKFSYTEALKNFGEGFLSPITGMFKSKENFLMGLAAIGGTAVLCALGAGPLIIAGWTLYGLYEAGSAVYTMTKAKNGDEVEQAFTDLGEATFIVGTSALTAKGVLGSSGVDTSEMSAIEATVESFKQSPASVVNTVNNVKTGVSSLTSAESALAGDKIVPNLKNLVGLDSITDAPGQTFSTPPNNAGNANPKAQDS